MSELDPHFDTENQKQSNKSLVINLSIALGVNLLFCLVIILSFANEGGYMSSSIGLILALLAFPIMALFTGIGFLIAGKNREGGVLLILALIGLSICGGR